MPDRSAAVKIAAVRGHGAAVDLIDLQTTTRADRLRALAAADPGARACSPFDEPEVIAGNATLGLEILERLRPDAIVAPMGGGGLCSGLCVATKVQAATTEVIGAEPLLANDVARSLRAGQIVSTDGEPDTICDGARTRSVGIRNFEILRDALGGMVEVPEAEIGGAMGLLASHLGLRAEPTGALALAAILAEPARFRGRQVACVVSGGNVDGGVYAQLIRAG